jgi:hypothetical protein
MITKSRTLASLSLAALLWAGAACDVAAPTELPAGAAANETPTLPSPEPPRIVTTLKHASGNEFRFVQGERGGMAVIETGAYPNTQVEIPIPPEKRTVLNVYQYLAPGQPVPRELHLAVARQEQAKAYHLSLPPGPLSTAPPDGVEAHQQAITGGLSSEGPAPDSGTADLDHRCPRSWFTSNFCRTPARSGDVCWTRKTGIGSFSGSDLYQANTATCVYRGAAVVRIETSDCWLFCGIRIEFAVGEGHWSRDVIFSGDHSGWDFEMKYTVIAGTGGMHMAGVLYH